MALVVLVITASLVWDSLVLMVLLNAAASTVGAVTHILIVEQVVTQPLASVEALDHCYQP
jgi:hypothetical protein